MNGVMILNTIEKFTTAKFPAIILFVASIVLMLVGFFSLLSYDNIKEKFNLHKHFIVIFVVISIIGVVGVACCNIFDDNDFMRESETRYQVIVDDTVGFNEFNDKYEIIGKDGKIYTVKEKN